MAQQDNSKLCLVVGLIVLVVIVVYMLKGNGSEEKYTRKTVESSPSEPKEESNFKFCRCDILYALSRKMYTVRNMYHTYLRSFKSLAKIAGSV